RLREARFDLVLLDPVLPDSSGLDLLASFDPARTAVVLASDAPTVASALGALRARALDYLVKPVDAVHFRRLLETAAARRSPAHVVPSVRVHGLIGDSEAMRGIVSQIERVAHAGTRVLVHGESGAGKAAVVAVL